MKTLHRFIQPMLGVVVYHDISMCQLLVIPVQELMHYHHHS